MKIYKHKAKAYAVLVKAGKYILSEDERENKKQELVPAEYVEAVAMELIEEGWYDYGADSNYACNSSLEFLLWPCSEHGK